MAWTLRPATLADLPHLVAHRDAMWLEMGRVRPGEDDPTSAAYGKWLADRMQAGVLHGFLAEEDGGVLASGCVWIQDVQPRPGHPLTMWGYLLSVYTVPAARRRGLARAIVTACMERARRAGCTRATLHASVVGRKLYEQLGFEPTDEMWADLRPPRERPRRRRTRRQEPEPDEPPVEVAALDSEALRRVRYHPTRGWLDVVFADGPEYRYFDVGPDKFLGLVQAESRGTFVNQRIKPAHPYWRLRRAEAGTKSLRAARKVVRS